jgi:hypothetical protein
VVLLAAPVQADARKEDAGAVETKPSENIPAFAGAARRRARRIDMYLRFIFPPSG